MDLGILNTVIALVIILLVLSLLVQAIQTLLKKILKMKSRQIEGSLKDLYEQVVGVQSPEPPPPSVQHRVRPTPVHATPSPVTPVEAASDVPTQATPVADTGEGVLFSRSCRFGRLSLETPAVSLHVHARPDLLHELRCLAVVYRPHMYFDFSRVHQCAVEVPGGFLAREVEVDTAGLPRFVLEDRAAGGQPAAVG